MNGIVKQEIKDNACVSLIIKLGLTISAERIKRKKWRNIGELVEVSFATYTRIPRVLRTFCYAITPDQDKHELVRLLQRLSPTKIETVLEIGTGKGGTAYLFSQIASADPLLITIDINPSELSRYYWSRFAKGKIHPLSMSSHDPRTKSLVKSILGNRKIDLLYIDGDHTFSGVKKDYDLYSSLVKDNGLIVFHDIADSKLGVPQLWKILKNKTNAQEIVSDYERDRYGIGVLQNEKHIS